MTASVGARAVLQSARRWRPAPRAVLALVVVTYVVLGLLVAVLTPPWEASDEPDHVQNVETMVDGRMYRIRAGSGIESHQPPLYYAVLAGWQRVSGVHPYRPKPRYGCNFFFERCEWVFAHVHAADGTDQRHVTLLRVPGVALGVLTVLLTALAARRLSSDPWTPVVAAATVAFVPRFVFLSGVVTNDNLANTLAAAATLLAVAAVALRGERGRSHLVLAFALGVVFGAIVLTKSTAMALAPGLALALFLSTPHRRDAVRLVALAGAAALLVSSPWLIFNTVNYGDPLAIAEARDYLMEVSRVPGQGAVIFVTDPVLEVLFETMPVEFYKGWWYESGWTAFEWSAWAYLPFWILTAAAIAGFWLGRGRPGQRAAIAILAVLLLVPVASVWVLGTDTHTAQARLALVGLPALACLVALGLERYPLPVAARFALPLLGLIGTMVAIRDDVVDVPVRPPQQTARPAAVATLSAPAGRAKPGALAGHPRYNSAQVGRHSR